MGSSVSQEQNNIAEVLKQILQKQGRKVESTHLKNCDQTLNLLCGITIGKVAESWWSFCVRDRLCTPCAWCMQHPITGKTSAPGTATAMSALQVPAPSAPTPSAPLVHETQYFDHTCLGAIAEEPEGGPWPSDLFAPGREPDIFSPSQ